MAKYDQLLLEYGGGVINPYSQSEACKEEACVVIGIGGTGIAALKRLKRNIYQRLLPDDPSAPVPTYSHIKFIAIDSDDIDPGLGRGKLFNSEIFGIRSPDLPGVIGTEKGQQTVRNDPSMSWMDIDNIIALYSPNGAGGIRQVGRYLLISKADSLKTKIHLACTTAMQAAHTNSVTVYIFAGISGGTGSGCFIDTCYIVRQLMNENGWSAAGSIMGFFFLPDVVNSKREVSASSTVMRWNNFNGYAAMKELNYLMNLELAEDRFYQKYGDFTIDTQMPPVDICYLVSATGTDGNVRPDGFNYCIDAVVDYVMPFLIGVEDGPYVNGNSYSEHIVRGVREARWLPQTHGAARIYHIFSSSNAEIPMTQFSTYLAAGFMDRFSQRVGREKLYSDIIKQKVDELAGNLELTPIGILAKVNHGTPSLILPDVDKSELKALCQMSGGITPESWAIPGNNFLDRSEDKRKANCTNLKEEIEDYSLEAMRRRQKESVICSIFTLLHTFCTDPECGPYCAAQLIHNNRYNLESVIDGVIATYEEQKNTQELCLHGRDGGGIADEIIKASADFINSLFDTEESAYSRYKKTVEDYFLTVNRIRELDDTISMMKTIKQQLGELYQTYFVPMIEMLDNLKETFDEDVNFLSLPEARQPSAYTWQILELSDVKESLDDAIKMLTPKSLVTDFLEAVMKNYQEWINRDSDRITAFISKFMCEMFDSQMNTSLQDYLKIKYPKAATPQDLAETIEKEIITKVFDDAAAMFWCDSNFSIESDTFKTANISVPLSAYSVCAAAENFQGHTWEPCFIRKTGLKDRISAIRLFSGIPFYAYRGVNCLKEEYDSSKAGGGGVGVHLYAKTGRGDDSTGDKDWINFLPTPSPYSKDKEMTVNADEKIKVYEKACELGIIGPDAADDTRWMIRVSKPVEEKNYFIEDFMTEDTQGKRILNQLAIDSTRDMLKDRLEHGWEEEKLERFIVMKNDGDCRYGEKVVSAVRMDYFLEFPLWQVTAREEIRKHEVLEDQLRQLAAIEKQYSETKDNLAEFCGLLFYGILKSENHQGKESYTKIARIYYSYKKYGIPMDAPLTGPGEEFPYGEQYPLYQAYLSYIRLDREKMPREEMVEKYENRKKGKLTSTDNIIGRTLELQWDDKAIRKLSDQLATYPEGKEILSFYTGLLQQIQDFRDKFWYKDWIRMPATAEEGEPSPRQSGPELPPPPPMAQVYVSDGSDPMVVYLEVSRNYAWSAMKNQWIPLQPNMWVYLNNEWKPITLDQQGNIVI